MRIAICTRSFRPVIGGLGSVTHAYAQGFIELGCRPIVVTSSPAPEGYDGQFPYPVVRRPGLYEFRRVLRGCEGVVFVHQSLVYMLWSFFLKKPVLSVLHGRIWNWGSVSNIVCSLAFELHLRIRPHAALISETVRSPATRNAPVIGNPYDASSFTAPTTPAEPGTIIFSGRLNRYKGIFDLTEAVRLLRLRGVPVKVTFVGAGPDEADLRMAVAAAGISGSTTFVGHSNPECVAALLRRHQIAAIPSDWDEPFGVVALEAIASGCYVVAYPDGGLPVAIGAAGLLTSDKSPDALATALQRVITDDALRKRIDENRRAHLEKFSCGRIAGRLLEMLSEARRGAVPIK
jgi:glycosyltransferase involved in cell wall biosynthesis